LLVDLLVDMVLGCKAADKMLAEVDWHGQVKVTVEVALGAEQILNCSMFDLDLLVLNESSLNASGPRNEQGETSATADVSELAAPESTVAILSCSYSDTCVGRT